MSFMRTVLARCSPFSQTFSSRLPGLRVLVPVPAMLGLLAGSLTLTPRASAEDIPLILSGRVVMEDGSAPGKSVGIERWCSDQASRPGPITNKEGEYVWRLAVDPMRSRQCTIRATMEGYISSEFNISALNGFTSTTFEVPDIILQLDVVGRNPRMINSSPDGIPGKVKELWNNALAEVRTGNNAKAQIYLEGAVQADAKFARGWQTLGILLESQQKPEEARAAYAKAIEADKKMLDPHVTLADLALKAGDWAQAAEVAELLTKQDKKRVFPIGWVHLAAARFHMDDLDGAQKAAEEAINPKEDRKGYRGEYVLGRVLEAKGDLAGAREHIEKYLSIDPSALDAEAIRASLDHLGETSASQPQLVP